MDESGFREPIRRDVEARRVARAMLGVSEGASRAELKQAWRRACRRHHPDRNPGDPDAARRFAALRCAYRLLAHGEPCDMLDAADASPTTPQDPRYRLDNAWGLFLWWRERFF